MSKEGPFFPIVKSMGSEMPSNDDGEDY
jgi:hypothetical protein